MSAGRRLLLGVLALCGCAQGAGSDGCGALEDPLAQIPVMEARLERISLSHTVAFVGPARGEAELVVVDDAEIEHVFPAQLEGIDAGLAIKASAALTFDAAIPLEVEPGALSARELLGQYEGPVVGVDVGLGLTYRRLENDAGVVLVLAGPSAGLGLSLFAYERLNLTLEDDPLQTTE